MKKRTLKKSLVLNKLTITALDRQATGTIAGGATFNCYRTVAGCASIKFDCIPQTEVQSCRCV